MLANLGHVSTGQASLSLKTTHHNKKKIEATKKSTVGSVLDINITAKQLRSINISTFVAILVSLFLRERRMFSAWFFLSKYYNKK